jgi:formiminoglutamase
MTEDANWPRASDWLAGGQPPADLTFIGIPTYQTSISPTQAHLTPDAVRQALSRYSTFADGLDIARVRVTDAGDVDEPDGPAGEARVIETMRGIDSSLVIAVGGDNSCTYSVALGRWGDQLPRAGLVTLDAHHDLRDGESNGSPVMRLIDAGLPGSRVVQIGIADFSNSPFYAQRAHDLRITVITRAALRTRAMADVMAQALDIAGALGGPIHVDLDVDVCDRSVVPACPAAAPGGISADELRQAARMVGEDPRVASVDITEIDAARDTADQRTVRLGALCVLEIAAGFARRQVRAGQC